MPDTNKIALLGSESLMGREVRDVVATSAPELDLRLIADAEDESGRLTAVGDEPAFIGGLTAENLTGVRAVILAGAEAASREALKLIEDEPDIAVIDLTHAAEELPDARVRAPAVEGGAASEESGIHVIAHPAAIALALFLRRLHEHDPIRRSVIQVFAPASELGKPGVDELQQQTVGLLSFKSLPKAVYDEQLAFNMLARYGEEAPLALEQAELRIERHLATLLAIPGEGEAPPMPSLRLIQAPVFHGYSFSAWVEFEGYPGLEAVESGLASDWIDVRGIDTEPPTNVGNAGQGGITVGAITEDRNNAEACWFWFVADNLRLAAENAVAVARQAI